MINTNFTQFFRRDAFSRLKQIYLQSNFNLLRECALREHGLDLRHDSARDHTALGADCVNFLMNARNNSKVLREVISDEATDASTA